MFNKYEFTKKWTSPSDFPTVETDESKVRADAQLLHDESKNAIHQLIDELAAETAPEHIGAKDENGGKVTLDVVLQALLLVKHTHGNLAEMERLVTEFNGKSVTESLVADHSKIPTSQAIIDQLDALGAGDMAQRVYDPNGKKTDIFQYADDAAETRAPMVHKHDAADVESGTFPPERGGTGKTTLHESLVALLASGDFIVNPDMIYEELPSPGVKNRLILKVVK